MSGEESYDTFLDVRDDNNIPARVLLTGPAAAIAYPERPAKGLPVVSFWYTPFAKSPSG